MEVTVSKPLLGMRILVTRAEEQAEVLSAKLRDLGAIPLEFPVIDICPSDEAARLDEAIRSLNQYHWVIFTSVNGVRFFLERMTKLEISKKVLEGLKVAAIGPATAAALGSEARAADYVPKQYVSEEIAKGLGEVASSRILLPRADIASKRLPEILRKRGAYVDEVVAYRTTLPMDSTVSKFNLLLKGGLDMVTFTSPSAVQNLRKILGRDSLINLLRKVRVACIGPVTAKAVEELGVDVEITAKTHTIDGLVEAMMDEIRPT